MWQAPLSIPIFGLPGERDAVSITARSSQALGAAAVVSLRMGARPKNARGCPLAKELEIKEGHRVAFPSAPNDFARLLEPLPEGVTIRSRARGPLDVIVFFTTRRSDLERRLPALRRALDPAGGLWIAWPKAPPVWRRM
jgi:hypothetical protein